MAKIYIVYMDEFELSEWSTESTVEKVFNCREKAEEYIRQETRSTNVVEEGKYYEVYKDERDERGLRYVSYDVE